MSTWDEKRIMCDECGEAGRLKHILPVADVLAYYCHDEEKSCYIYVLLKAA